MNGTLSERIAEAEELVMEVKSWTDIEINELPRFYREKARELQEQFSED